jgi:hypothetical protein
MYQVMVHKRNNMLFENIKLLHEINSNDLQYSQPQTCLYYIESNSDIISLFN